MSASTVSEARKALRANLFQRRDYKSKLIQIFGIDVEVRQPTIGQVMRDRDAGKIDSVTGLLEMLILYCRVPGTEEAVFETGDVDSLKEWPAGAWLPAFTGAVNELTEVNIPDTVKN
jgi:hypothetical protein